jgi:hypothetical protein
VSTQQILFFSGLGAGILLGVMLTLLFAVKPLQKQAVERNVAEWVVDYNGNTTWQWKEEAK